MLSEDNFSKPAYIGLIKCVLAGIILFNRRRSGEAAKLELSTVERTGWIDNQSKIVNKSISPEIEKSLSTIEKQLVKKLVRIETLGTYFLFFAHDYLSSFS